MMLENLHGLLPFVNQGDPDALIAALCCHSKRLMLNQVLSVFPPAQHFFYDNRHEINISNV